jgi:methionine aminotransferase
MVAAPVSMTPRAMPNPQSLQSKLPDVGTTIFTVMSQLAADCGAINLSQGFPSFNPDPELIRLVDHHMRAGANQYAPMPGAPALRHEIAAKVARLYGRIIDENTEVTVCTGATEGLFSTVQAMVRPGDEVIVFDPAYDSYQPAVTLAGGRAIHVPLFEQNNEFRIDWQRLHDSINVRTRLIILNFPQNPTGTVLTGEDLGTLAAVLRGTQVFLLSDEVYEHIIFDGVAHQSLLRHEELWQRAFVISSFGKTYHATGWKVGYCVAPAPLTVEFRKVHQFTTFAVATPMQHAIADYMARTPQHYEELPAFYEAKRDRFCALVKDSRFRFHPAQGTFFQILDYSAITDEPDVDYAKRLTHEIGVASIPISVFCEEPPPGRKLRFCFAKDDAMLEEAGRKLCQL